MGKKIGLFLSYYVLVSGSIVFPQNQILGKQISVYGGIGVLAIRDEYISLRRYSGQYSTLGTEWVTLYDSMRTHFSVEYQHGGSISNNNSKADVYQTRLYYDNQFYSKKLTFLGKETDWFIGPAGIMATHIRIQQVADKNFPMETYLSFYVDNAVAVSTSLSMSLNESWFISSNASLDIVSVGIKLVDFTKQVKDPTVKFMLPFSNLNGRFDVGLEYMISNDFKVSGKYLFQFLRNNSWDYLLTAGDNIVVKASYDW